MDLLNEQQRKAQQELQRKKEKLAAATKANKSRADVLCNSPELRGVAKKIGIPEQKDKEIMIFEKVDNERYQN